MELNCETCNAKFEIGLIDCETDIIFSFYCIFCGKKLLERIENKKFIPEKILNYPIPQIALPGIIDLLLNNYMEEYKNLFKEFSIKKGQAKSSLDISFSEPDYVPLNGWTYLELEGLMDDRSEIKTIEDLFKGPGMGLRVYFLHDLKQVQIPNIMIPYMLRHKGIGKHIISMIYDACKMFGYRLLIVQMVDSFFNRLIDRGAVMIDEETVEITGNTKLD